MKRSTLIAGIAVMTLAAGAGVATAHGKKAGMDGMRGGPVLNFEEIDANGDGKLTQDEMKAHAEARFKAADTDGNGKLSADEMKAAAQKREEERRAQRAERMASRMIERMGVQDPPARLRQGLRVWLAGTQGVASRWADDPDIGRDELVRFQLLCFRAIVADALDIEPRATPEGATPPFLP